jgi:MFS family permease
MFDSAFFTRKPTPRGRIMLLLAGLAVLAGLGRDGIYAVTGNLRVALDRPNDDLVIAYGAYGFAFFPALVLGGALVELLGTEIALTICGAGILAGTAVIACAWTLALLTLGRLLLGAGIGALLPVAAAALAPWTPPRERGWAMGSFQGALAAGAALGGPLISLGVLAGAWRAGFVLVALGCVCWLVARRRWYQAGPARADAEAPVERPLPVNWRGAAPILALPIALALLQGWGMVLCEQWVPQYLLASWHFDIKLSGWVAAASGLALVLGALVGGYAADRSLNHSGNIRSAHQVVPGIGFLLAALSLMLLPIGEHEGAIAFWLGLALFGLQAAGTMLWVFAIDIGGRHPGISAGAVGFGLLLARLFSPMLLFGLGRSLPAALVVTMLVLAGVLSFRLRPHIDLPVVVSDPTITNEPEDKAVAEIDELLESSGKKRRA